MASVGEQVTQMVADVLNAGANAPAKFYRTRVDAFAVKELPAGVVYAIDEQVARQSSNIKLRTRKIRVELMVEGEAPADSLIDPLYIYVVNTLLADAGLAQYLRRLEESHIQWETEASYQDASIAVIDFEAVFVTTNDPTERVDG